MQEYQAIIEKFGEPFPVEGRRSPSSLSDLKASSARKIIKA